MNISFFKAVFILLLLHSGLLLGFNPMHETAAKKIQVAFAKIKRHRDAIKVKTFKDLIRENGIQLLSEEDHAQFYELDDWEDKIAYLLHGFGMLSDRYKKGDVLLIDKLEIIDANETDAVYAVKILRQNSEHMVYVVKIPTKRVMKRECLGLFWVRELLPNLPRNFDWALLNFHEAMFWNKSEEQAIIFLHAAKGKPWCSYIDEIGASQSEVLASNIEKHLADIRSLGKTIGTLEAKFIKDIGRARMRTITFPDFHAGNVFFDKITSRFSYIDLNNLGISAKQYFSNQFSFGKDYNDVADGLGTMILWLEDNQNSNEGIHLLGLAKIIFHLKKGYSEAFESFEDKSKREIIKIVFN